jgi:DMSO/TMAO reductase YedYZ molybdopterin-dependent catalytic subunit
MPSIPSGAMQLPPGQQLVAAGKWPLVGERAPKGPLGRWSVRVHGLVGSPRTFSLAEMVALPRVERIVDIHCVTRWSKPGVRFGGLLLADLSGAVNRLPRDDSPRLPRERNHSIACACRGD